MKEETNLAVLSELPDFLNADTTLKTAITELTEGKGIDGIDMPFAEDGKLLPFDERVVWAVKKEEKALKQAISRGLNYQSLLIEKNWKQKDLTLFLKDKGVSKQRISEDLNIANFYLDLFAQLQQNADGNKEDRPTDKNKTLSLILNNTSLKSFQSLKKLGANQTLFFVNEGIIKPDEMKRKEMQAVIHELTSSGKREQNIEKKYLKSKEEIEELKQKLELAEGKRTNIDPTLFYYTKQSNLLVEDATQAALGFEELLHEFNSYTDPGKNKVWEAVGVGIFMSCQGALSKMLASFNRLKAVIPQDFQTEQSARLNAFTEEMIVQMSYELDVHRSTLASKKINRQTSVRATVKNKGK